MKKLFALACVICLVLTTGCGKKATEEAAPAEEPVVEELAPAEAAVETSVVVELPALPVVEEDKTTKEAAE